MAAVMVTGIDRDAVRIREFFDSIEEARAFVRAQEDYGVRGSLRIGVR